MNPHTGLEVCSSHIAIERYASITLLVFVDKIWMSDVLVSINKNIRMGVSPNQRTVLEESRRKLIVLVKR
jgi:hypothetical protein